MLFPRELIEEIRAQNDIVDVISAYVPLKQKGSSHFGLCPFHHEKSPSFSVDRPKQFFYCFGCGEAGNVYSFVMKMENCSFVEAVERLAERVHISLPSPEVTPRQAEAAKQRQRLLELHKIAGRFYYNLLHAPEGQEALRYLEKRQIQPGIQKKFGLGYASSNRQALLSHLRQNGFSDDEIVKSGLVLQAKENPKHLYDRFSSRLMFPILDVQGQVIGFGGRILKKGEPKYLNSPETMLFNKSKTLFGLNFARAARKKEIILVEGYMDMISLYQAGFKNTAACLGTAFNQEHAHTLKRYADSVILLYDSDDAGCNAALRAIPVLVGNGFTVKVLQVPSGKDPDEYIRENGPMEFSKLLISAKSYISFQIDYLKQNYNLENIQHKVQFTTEAAKVLAKLENDIERSAYIQEVGNMAGIAHEAIASEVQKFRQKEQDAFLKEANAKRKEQYTFHASSGETPKGLQEAQREVLGVCASNPIVYEKLSKLLDTDDFIEPVYQKAFALLGEMYRANETVIPGGFISRFETAEEQKRIAEVFAVKEPFSSIQDFEKGFNEEWKLLKKASIDKKAQSASSVMEVKELLETKRKLETLYIPISDG